MARHIFQPRRGWKDDVSGRNDWDEYEKKESHVKPFEGEITLEYDNGIPRLKIGDGVNEFSSLPYMSVDSFILPRTAFVRLDSTKWTKSADDRYCQVVAVQNAIITSNSKVDLQISPEDLSVFCKKDLAFTTENEDGIIRVYCVGRVPQNDYILQATVTEVATKGEKIIGDVVATPASVPDWEQAIEDLKGQIAEMEKRISALENNGSSSGGSLNITDDGAGNVAIETIGSSASITDDGAGNVTIEAISDNISITDDGNGNVVIQ